MSVESRISTSIVATDIAERIGCWEDAGRQLIHAAIAKHGMDTVWQMAEAAQVCERLTGVRRDQVFFALVKARKKM